jgi:hypothetical protein
MIYNWLNEDNKDILIKMIEDRLRIKFPILTLKSCNVKKDKCGEFSKYISFNVSNQHLEIVISNNGQICYQPDFSEQLSDLQQQVEQYILQESRDKKLNQLLK